MQIRTVGVIGAGQMGSGIAHVAAAAGYSVLLADLEGEYLEKARAAIARNLEREVAKGKRSAKEQAAALERITTTTVLSEFAQAQVVIEAVIEEEGVKKDLLRTLDSICGEDVILASNTSSISITRLAAATRSPGRFIGMHFFNPVPVMELVEVIRGIATSDETAS